MFEAALKKFSIRISDLDVRLELPSNEAVRVAVESGDCATAISDPVVAQSPPPGTLHHVKINLGLFPDAARIQKRGPAVRPLCSQFVLSY